MKLVQWPDNFPDLSDATPNLPALRRIGFGFVAMLAFCVLMMFVTMAHSPRQAVANAKPLPCHCPCLRKAGSP
jgi:hypothetical protein